MESPRKVPVRVDLYGYSNPDMKTNGRIGPEPSNTEKQQEELTWRHVLYEFSQSTTIHGLNKITEDTPFTLRRVIWFLLVLTGGVLFGYQLISSVVHYYERPVSVNMKINYVDSVKFPSVTICNQNSFRVTKAAESGLYDTLRNMYSSGRPINTSDSDPYFGNGNVSTLDVFQMTAHSKEDFIIMCRWDNRECYPRDFETIVTDHGICYSFNLAIGEPVKNASQTGADHGLRMTLNIEQYEYMRGPHDSAGIKILIHDQNEVPLVKDLGQAVPPGSHAFVGLTVLDVSNEQPPYGKCNDSVQLDFFDRYSVPACGIECKLKSLVAECKCRDVYMPDTVQGYSPVCNISQYMTCLKPTLSAFDHQSSCDCPIPCHRRLFDSTITYATLSNYNTDSWLQSNRTSEWSKKFLKARETVQRVDDSIVAKDTSLINDLVQKIYTIDDMLERINSSVFIIEENREDILTEITPRINFHYDRGLTEVDYIYDNDFRRGWDVMDERTFRHVTAEFYQVTASFDKMINDSLSADDNRTNYRETLYMMTDYELAKKLNLAQRALDNLTKVHEAYTNGTHLLKYKATPDRRYDLLYMELEVVRHDTKNELSYYDKFKRYIGEFIVAIQKLRTIAKEIFEIRQYNETIYQQAKYKFELRSRSFNYYIYMYLSRIVEDAKDIVTEQLRKFNETNSEFHDAIEDISLHTITLKANLKRFNENVWNNVKLAADHAVNYLNDTRKSKANLSRLFTSDEVEELQRQVDLFFSTVRDRAIQLRDGSVRLQHAYTNLWANMLGEFTLKTFYSKIYNDTETIFTSTDAAEVTYLRSILRRMLRISKSKEAEFAKLNKSDIQRLTNSDFPKLTIANKSAEIARCFENLKADTDIVTFIGSYDEQFHQSFDALQTDLKDFLDNSIVGVNFFRENFLQMDIFLKELSYQEIIQNIAYDGNSLWSDIGGSLGLFVGASVITVFELFDVIIHTLMRTKVSTVKSKQEQLRAVTSIPVK